MSAELQPSRPNLQNNEVKFYTFLYIDIKRRLFDSVLFHINNWQISLRPYVAKTAKLKACVASHTFELLLHHPRLGIPVEISLFT